MQGRLSHRLWFALALILAAPSPAFAVLLDTVPQCHALTVKAYAEVNNDVLVAAAEECQFVAMGIVPLEQRAAQGDRVLRAGIWHGERATPVFVEYVRPRIGRPWLAVRTSWEGLPHRIVRISNRQFAAVWSRWRAQPRFVAAGEIADAGKKADEIAQGEELVCISSGSGTTVEIADRGRSRTVELDSCKSGDYAFSRFLVRQAQHGLGRCGPPRFSDADDVDRLIACLPD